MPTQVCDGLAVNPGAEYKGGDEGDDEFQYYEYPEIVAGESFEDGAQISLELVDAGSGDGEDGGDSEQQGEKAEAGAEEDDSEPGLADCRFFYYLIGHSVYIRCAKAGCSGRSLWSVAPWCPVGAQ